MEFYVMPDCVVTIRPRDAIMCMVRMEWTFASFYAKGGTTLFIDRLASSLGIHSSRIKIVSVYEGSLIINYAIHGENDSSLGLSTTLTKQIELFVTG